MTRTENNKGCYKCEYRGTVPGDAHSCCNYPGTDSSILGFLLNGEKNFEIAEKLNIRANDHGIRKGWFNWPSNFDPVWLENCDGFSPKDTKDVSRTRETT